MNTSRSIKIASYRTSLKWHFFTIACADYRKKDKRDNLYKSHTINI